MKSPVLNSICKFCKDPVPIPNQVPQWINKVSQALKTIINMLKSIGKKPSDPAQKINIQVIMEKAQFVQVNMHATCLTKCVQNNFKGHPFLKRTYTEHNHIICKEQMCEGKLGQNIDTPDSAIRFCIFNQ